MSKIKTSPPLDICAACSTRFDASGIVIKYLVTFLSVTVTGPPLDICSKNKGITEPEELITFPKRTIENFVSGDFVFKD